MSLAVFCVSELRLLFYFKPLISFLTAVFLVFINCSYSTVKLVKCCIYVCYVQTEMSYLLTNWCISLSRVPIRIRTFRPQNDSTAYAWHGNLNWTVCDFRSSVWGRHRKDRRTDGRTSAPERAKRNEITQNTISKLLTVNVMTFVQWTVIDKWLSTF